MGSYKINKKDADAKHLPKMKAKWKKKWLKALRSGNYKQGTEVLMYSSKEYGDRYCCLGVLCDIVKDEMGDDFDFYNWTLPPKEVWELVLTKDTLKKAGASAEALWNDYYASMGLDEASLSVLPLTMRNDGNGLFEGRQRSFKKIANIIEKHM